MKKYLVLIVLFLLPISVYLFFATGINNFVKLPIVSEGVSELSAFKAIDGSPIRLENKITVLLFFGNSVDARKANAFNLAHKIYKKNHQFEEFQFVTLITEDQREAAQEVTLKLAEIENPEHWQFAIGSAMAIEDVYKSLQTSGTLNDNFASDKVFIIDKEKNLRGRTDDEDYGTLYGYNAADYAEINNKMSDDIKIVLAEYRLALKKYSSNREI
ncbi:hypothetical protein G5B37_11455 [Rasiella rasia]|uniref:Uncharacterized protein n=1 Tax=Rasiella rasia TaxID=2744027 RepID=A0A6G6GNP6_9FLAO|nr:hypothetical protein [Rasiella rasia]QIE60154.1 hypothetical protein G5B37_11455 [Rasiella rasia]